MRKTNFEQTKLYCPLYWLVGFKIFYKLVKNKLAKLANSAKNRECTKILCPN